MGKGKELGHSERDDGWGGGGEGVWGEGLLCEKSSQRLSWDRASEGGLGVGDRSHSAAVWDIFWKARAQGGSRLVGLKGEGGDGCSGWGPWDPGQREADVEASGAWAPF